MRDRATAYAMLALLLVLFWTVCNGIAIRAVRSKTSEVASESRSGSRVPDAGGSVPALRTTENNPTHEWGQGFSAPYPATKPTATSRDSWTERFKPQPYVTDQPTCEWMCARSGLYAQWSARDVPCVCGVAP